MSEPADRDGPASALERFVLESGDLLRSLVADDEVVAEIEADGRLLGLWSPNRDLLPGSELELVGRSLDDLIGPEEGPDVLATERWSRCGSPRRPRSPREGRSGVRIEAQVPDDPARQLPVTALELAQEHLRLAVLGDVEGDTVPEEGLSPVVPHQHGRAV